MNNNEVVPSPDAHLIAAAPELKQSVEALSFILPSLCEALGIDLETEVNIKSATGEKIGGITLDIAIRQARAAIGKATGKEPA